MENELFSRGRYAEVSVASGREKFLFPKADLIRTETKKDPHQYMRLFYAHKMAHLLFPRNFIEVVGVTAKHDDACVTEYHRTSSLFSRKAAVADDHAIYAAHMGVRKGGQKSSTCDCATCASHHEFHESDELTMRAMDLAVDYFPTGIFTPWDDGSDYCLAGDDIVFFEIEGFRHSQMREFLPTIEDAVVRERMSCLLDRYEQYYLLSLRDEDQRKYKLLQP